MEDWDNIKKRYPDIEEISNDIPDWQKEIIDARLSDINNSDHFKSIEHLFDFLDEEV